MDFDDSLFLSCDSACEAVAKEDEVREREKEVERCCYVAKNCPSEVGMSARVIAFAHA